MDPIECMDSYSAWDQRVRSALLDDVLINNGAAFIRNNPYYTRQAQEESIEATVKELKNNLSRPKEGKRAPRKIFLEDLYALCKITEQTPNYYLINSILEESDRKEFLEYLIRDRKALVYFIGQNKVFNQFVSFFCGRDPLKIPKIKLPEDAMFLNFFQAQILMRLPKTVRLEKPSTSEKTKAAEANKEHRFSYRFTLATEYDNYKRLELFAQIIEYAALSNPRATKIVNYGFLNQDFLKTTWTVPDVVKVNGEFPPLSEDGLQARWTAKNRFIISVNAYLLLCVLSTVVEMLAYQNGGQVSLEKEEWKQFVDDNIDIKSIINELFIGSFFFLSDHAIIAAYGKFTLKTTPKPQEIARPSFQLSVPQEDLGISSRKGRDLKSLLSEANAPYSHEFQTRF